MPVTLSSTTNPDTRPSTHRHPNSHPHRHETAHRVQEIHLLPFTRRHATTTPPRITLLLIKRSRARGQKPNRRLSDRTEHADLGGVQQAIRERPFHEASLRALQPLRHSTAIHYDHTNRQQRSQRVRDHKPNQRVTDIRSFMRMVFVAGDVETESSVHFAALSGGICEGREPQSEHRSVGGDPINHEAVETRRYRWICPVDVGRAVDVGGNHQH
mmetsp:Transcript_63265/g.100602  ORF Transcript_63265/g.100602 Transcript_63265/m.100602 type:complete len:214 (+) Transcript_63265:214-855(+)